MHWQTAYILKSLRAGNSLDDPSMLDSHNTWSFERPRRCRIICGSHQMSIAPLRRRCVYLGRPLSRLCSYMIVLDTVYACQDLQHDVQAGIKSTAVLLGSHIREILFFSPLWSPSHLLGQDTSMARDPATTYSASPVQRCTWVGSFTW